MERLLAASISSSFAAVAVHLPVVSVAAVGSVDQLEAFCGGRYQKRLLTPVELSRADWSRRLVVACCERRHRPGL